VPLAGGHNDLPLTASALSSLAFVFKPVSVSDVHNVLIKLPSSGSPGADEISASMLKFVPDVISNILAKLFNLSLASGSFPVQWKAAVVTPVYKKGSKIDLNNYRPISVLPLVSKIFERLVDRQLRGHLEGRGFLSRHQYGFRKSRSCQSALLSLTDSLFTRRQNKQHSIVASLDYSKAFDLLDHETLINKMATLGMADSTTAWFKSYLEDRRQCVKYNNVLSDYVQVVYGVPEGSVLGPTLFVIYINDLLHRLPDCSVMAYADDLTLTVFGDTVGKATLCLQELLSIVHSWSVSNFLHLNAAKCFVMYISPSLRLRSPLIL
jgi:hypothetical protein